jgi:hypothetical protein
MEVEDHPIWLVAFEAVIKECGCHGAILAPSAGLHNYVIGLKED